MSVAKTTADDIRALVEFVKNEYERGEAENQRKQNEVERQQAESQRRSNEDLRILAESQRVTNEAARQTAENVRSSAESSRMAAEANRVNAENLRVSSEQDRVSAENIRIAAESDRNDAELNRSVAEQERQDAEAQRVSNEQAREQAEQLREQAEDDRVAAESERASQEAIRVSAETARANAESDRVSAEYDRAAAEQARQAAEVIREQAKNDAIAATQAALSATQDAVDAASDATDAASNATSAAQAANDAADRANTEAEKIENLVHKGEYNSGTLYLMNNEVLYNGSTWRALQDTQGNTPQEGPYWTLVAQRGLDGQGAVQSVAGKQPDLDGDVPLVAADIGAETPAGAQAKVDAAIERAVKKTGDTMTGNLTMAGSKFQLNRPNTSGGWSRGIDIRNLSGSVNEGGMGFYGGGDNPPERAYIGFGTVPWNDSNGLMIRPDSLKFKGKDVVLADDLTAVQTNLNNHANATTGVHGATSAATPNTIVQRDSAGRAKVAAPAASDDIARKAETDAALSAAQAAQNTADAALPKDGSQSQTKLVFSSATDLTITAGAITVTQTMHRVDTEGAAATDDLTTINGGTNGQFLVLQTVTAARDVVIKHNVGNIFTFDGIDIAISDSHRGVMLVFNGTVWMVMPVGLQRTRWNIAGYLEYNDGGTWKAVGGMKNVQRGTATLVHGETSKNVTISSVNLSKAYVNISFHGGSASSVRSAMASAKLTSATNLAIQRQDGLATLTVEWEVIEFN